MKFSVITCTYNNVRHLGDLIDSASVQEHGDFEHIFVDGFSIDGTVNLIEDYAARFPKRVKMIETAPQGIADAMNKGIERATGDYLIFLHSDDKFIDPKVLSDVSNFLEANGFPDWIFGREKHILIDGRMRIYPRYKLYTGDSRSFWAKRLLNYVNYIRHQTVFIKPEVFKKYGMFRTDLSTVMDVEYWLRIKDYTHWLFFDRLISEYSHRPEAQSTGQANEKANRAESRRVYREYLGPFGSSVYLVIDKLLALRVKLLK